MKAGVSGLILSLLLAQFLPMQSVPGRDLADGEELILIAILLVAYPISTGCEYLARRTILRTEQRFSAGKGQRVSLFWSISAFTTGMASALGLFAFGLFLAAVPTMVIGMIAIAAHGLLRAHNLVASQTGPERARAVFESVGRVNLTGEIVAGLGFVAIFAMAALGIFADEFSGTAIVYLFVIRFFLSAVQQVNVNFQRIVALTGHSLPTEID